MEYFKKNLDVAFDYAIRLNKPVIPFVWYLIHPSNKRYRYEMIPRMEMLTYIDYIHNYKSYNNNSISGMVWWDTPTPYNNNVIKDNLSPNSEKRRVWTMEEEFRYYFNMQ